MAFLKNAGKIINLFKQRTIDRIGTILLECSDLPPYAQAVQAVTGRPVFDFNSMIHHVERACVARCY